MSSLVNLELLVATSPDEAASIFAGDLQNEEFSTSIISSPSELARVATRHLEREALEDTDVLASDRDFDNFNVFDNSTSLAESFV